MANHRLYDKFAARLGDPIAEGDETFVNALLSEAEDKTCDYIGREKVPKRLESFVVKISVIAFNKRGAEGESSRAEGGIQRAFDDLPEDELARLRNYPRKVGVVYATDGS